MREIRSWGALDGLLLLVPEEEDKRRVDCVVGDCVCCVVGDKVMGWLPVRLLHDVGASSSATRSFWGDSTIVLVVPRGANKHSGCTMVIMSWFIALFFDRPASGIR